MPSGYSNGIPNKPPSYLGKHHSDSARLKISQANKGRKMTPEQIKKHADLIRGRKHSEETKEKHRAYMLAHPIKYWLGKSKPLSEETKKKISKANTGKKAPAEVRFKMSMAKKKNPIRYWLGKKRLDMIGEKNPSWNGGISFEPYSVDWTETLRRSIREKDRYVCQICNKQQGDRAFCVHHIDYNKKNNNPYNLITLCFSCHLKTNFSRENWIKYFNNKYKRLTIVKSGNNAYTS